MTKTKFANGVNPFTGESAGAVNVAALEITNDPLIITRQVAGKYDRLFRTLKYGQWIKCQPGQAAKIKDALKKWLEKNGKQGTVRHTSKYQADGLGRVWLLEEKK